jgi:polysaccharide export outer membrane protein/exopolysaccharide production protein ExoF
VRQQINTLKGQRNALIDERRSIALVELQSLDAQRRELNEKIETASRLISGSASMLPRRDESETEATPVFVIIRQIEGKPVELPAVETTVIHPGDIVKVYRAHDVGSSGRSSSSLSDQKLSIEARGK